jgi:orotidine-5'-phosphate decarboxylase
MSFHEILARSALMNSSIISMGLDPVVAAFPDSLAAKGIKGAVSFYDRIFSRMEKDHIFPGAFKINQGFFACHDQPLENEFPGSKTMASLVRMIRERFPHMPLILDFKRGDIATASDNYAREGFEGWGADALTVSPYMGSDSVSPFLQLCTGRRGVYLLNRNSNAGARDFQNLTVMIDEGMAPLYMAVARKIAAWAETSPVVGAVVAATTPGELEELALFYADKKIPLLIPGVGAQGGSAGEVTRRLRVADYELALVRINCSSGISHPWHVKGESAPHDYPAVCVKELLALNEAVDLRSGE